MFEIHPALAKDTTLVTLLPLCTVLLMNDARYPWLILVPVRDAMGEIHDLKVEDQRVLLQEIVKTSKIMKSLYTPDKINIGALGNLVPQLHVHVIARYKDDFAWPGPVWGQGDAVPYDAGKLKTLRDQLVDVFEK